MFFRSLLTVALLATVAATVVTHDQPPGGFGKARLLEQGALNGVERNYIYSNGLSSVSKTAGMLVVDMGANPSQSYIEIVQPASYRITRALKLPPHICYGAGQKFVLPADVAPPEPTTCMPCVISEATGQPIIGAQCQ